MMGGVWRWGAEVVRAGSMCGGGAWGVVGYDLECGSWNGRGFEVCGSRLD